MHGATLKNKLTSWQ